MQRRSAFVLIAVLALAGAAPAGASAPASPGAASPDEARKSEVIRAILDWADARVRGDAEFLERFYAPELRIGGANGAMIERADDIALFAARQIKPEFIRNTDIVVRLHGDTAVVTCVESLKGTYRGTPGDMSLRMLNVLVHRDGRWQLVATQSAQIAER